MKKLLALVLAAVFVILLSLPAYALIGRGHGADWNTTGSGSQTPAPTQTPAPAPAATPTPTPAPTPSPAPEAADKKQHSMDEAEIKAIRNKIEAKCKDEAYSIWGDLFYSFQGVSWSGEMTSELRFNAETGRFACLVTTQWKNTLIPNRTILHTDGIGYAGRVENAEIIIESTIEDIDAESNSGISKFWDHYWEESDDSTIPEANSADDIVEFEVRLTEYCYSSIKEEYSASNNPEFADYKKHDSLSWAADPFPRSFLILTLMADISKQAIDSGEPSLWDKYNIPEAECYLTVAENTFDDKGDYWYCVFIVNDEQALMIAYTPGTPTAYYEEQSMSGKNADNLSRMGKTWKIDESDSDEAFYYLIDSYPQ